MTLVRPELIGSKARTKGKGVGLLRVEGGVRVVQKCKGEFTVIIRVTQVLSLKVSASLSSVP